MPIKKLQNEPLDLRAVKDNSEDSGVNDKNAKAEARDNKTERPRVDLEKIKQEWLAKQKTAKEKEFVMETEKREIENKPEGKEGIRTLGNLETGDLGEVFKKVEEVNVPAGEYEFPKGFLWGTSTSAYQVEGGITNDWSEWERSLPRLQKLMKKGKKSIDFISAEACDSYNRYEEDLDLAADLNNNAIRIGLEWARIEPEKGAWSTQAISHYRRVLKAAKARGLSTVVTLWHWTIPLWFKNEGGWTSKKAVERFSDYAELIVGEIGADIDYWVTLNEPMLLANYGYLLGKFPPQKHSYFKFKKVSKNLIEAHKAAYKIIHKHFPRARVSITNLSNVFEPKRKWFLPDMALAALSRHYGLHKFFEKIKDYIDYIGIDYYRKIYIKSWPPFMDAKSNRLSDMGWEIYPRGIYEIIKYFEKFKKPMFILENGLADAEDQYRPGFIKEHLYWVHEAIKEGADVRGYFHWSLLDNFEWDKGYKPKFGLYAVDRETFKRTARPSAGVYKEICRDNKLIIK